VNLDIRVPLGLLFSVIGVLLLGYGLAVSHLGAGAPWWSNIDAWWGGVLAAFGALMLILARRAR
jgi:formate hydrogenlyase subunit 3/multisubunit Na+/H+ antiporter MnhD subunit